MESTSQSPVRLLDDDSNHRCHAIQCSVRCKPEHLMCRRHWFMVPRAIQQRVWATYRAGQCDDMQPSLEWIDAAKDAISAVAEKEKISSSLIDLEMMSWDGFAAAIRSSVI